MARENVLLSLRVRSSRRDRPDAAIRMKYKMAERPVLVGLIPQAVVLDPGDQVSWISTAEIFSGDLTLTAGLFRSKLFEPPGGFPRLRGPPQRAAKGAWTRTAPR